MAENEEPDKIKLFEDTIKVLEQKLNNETDNWQKTISKLSNAVKSDIKQIIEAQAEIISYKQFIIEEIRKYSLLMFKDSPLLKTLKKNRFEYYSTGYPIKLSNGSDKKVLIESDISKIQYKFDLLETHINYLRETASNLETLSYSVKNRIQLLDILGAN